MLVIRAGNQSEHTTLVVRDLGALEPWLVEVMQLVPVVFLWTSGSSIVVCNVVWTLHHFSRAMECGAMLLQGTEDPADAQGREGWDARWMMYSGLITTRLNVLTDTD